MILAVAGKSQDAVKAETKRLANSAAGLSTAEKVAFEFVRKQAATPWDITDADITNLERELGRDRAWQVIWWAARCHYMTKVADAFQLPLEKVNPFQAMPGAKPIK